MDNHEFEKETSLKDVLGSFIRSYTERDKGIEFSAWLENRLQQEIPDMSQGACEKLAGEIIEAVAGYNKTLNELNTAIDGGQSKEEWFAGRLSETYADMSLDIAGERLQQIENDLTVSNMQLIQEVDETQAEIGEVSVIEGNSIEWNEYSIKNKAYEIGNQVILTGITAAANVLKERVQSDEAVDIGSIVMDTLQDGLKNDSGEVKAVVAGAVKVAVEKGLTDIVSEDTPTGIISDMAGAAVESAEALFDAASGESTVTEALDKIGRAVTAGCCHCACDVLKGCLSKVPRVGSALVVLAGGLFDRMKRPEFAENVYTTVRGVATSAWEGVKRVGQGLKFLTNRAKKIFN